LILSYLQSFWALFDGNALTTRDASTTASVVATPTSFVDKLKFWNRHTWRDFYFEYAVLSLISLYYALHYLGKKRNQSLAQSWIRSHRPLLSSQFAQFGIPSDDGRVVPLSHDGGGIYESFATGRVNIHRLWVEMKLDSRHDIVAWVVESFMGFLYEGFGNYGDLVETIIDPSCDWEGFTWSVVKKSKMRSLRDKRYDLVLPPHPVSSFSPSNLPLCCPASLVAFHCVFCEI
jgi:hypothetical protein